MIMNDKKIKKVPNVPNLRFLDDTEAWNEHLLGEICTFLKGNGISKGDLSNTGFPCILYGQLYTTYKKEIIKYVLSKTDTKLSKPILSVKNDVIIPGSGETPEDIATACCVLVDNVLYGGDLNIIRLYKHNGVFLSYQLNGKRKFDIAKIAQGKSIVHLHNEDLSKLKIYYPSKTNITNKIVSLLEKIDNRIETQSKIIKENLLYKNCIINTLIFHNELLNKQIKLEEIATIKNGYSFKSNLYKNDGIYKVITIANVTGDRYIQTKSCNLVEQINNDVQPHQILKINDILISLTGNVGRVSLVNETNCLLNQRVGVLVPFIESYREYIYQVISTRKFENNMILAGQGAAQKNIGNFDILNFKIPITDNIDYLNKISSILRKIDLKIQKETDMLDLYIRQKSFFLKNLFI